MSPSKKTDEENTYYSTEDLENFPYCLEDLDLLLPEFLRLMFRFLEMAPLKHKTITVAQTYLLRQIQLKGPLTASEIGSIMGTTSGPVTTITSRLSKQGFITRQQSIADRRVAEFSLTPAGELVLKEAMTAQKAKFADLFTQLGSEKCRHLFALISQLTAILSHLLFE